MPLLLSVFGAVLVLIVVIVLHELGHFLVARLFGIRVLRFSIGFGKALYKKVGRSGTEYVIALVPLGGYVKMFGEGSEPVSIEQRASAYEYKPLLVRMAVVLAGPLTNFLLAIVVFWLAYQVGVEHIKPIVGEVRPASYAAIGGLQAGDEIVRVGSDRTYNWQQVMLALLVHMGDQQSVAVQVRGKSAHGLTTKYLPLDTWRVDTPKPDLFESLGFYPYLPDIKPVLAGVVSHSPAARAGLQRGDIIQKVNGKAVHTWQQVVSAVSNLGGQRVAIALSRGSIKRSLFLTVEKRKLGGVSRGYLGVLVVTPPLPSSMIFREHYSPISAWLPALSKTWQMVTYNAEVLYKMVTAKLSFKTMGGPISIFQAAGQATEAGIEPYLSFLAFISLTVGFINLLPIPGLDGGHFLYQVIEAVLRRPLSLKVQQYGFTLGILFVLFIVLHATFNDLQRIFS